MIPESLTHLLATAPAWVEASISAPGRAAVRARPPLPSGRRGGIYDLAVVMDPSGKIAVREGTPGTALPTCCPERHINSDGSFCVHLHSTAPISGAEDARLWWRSLHAFFLDQGYAAKHRFWPLHSQLSHGEAGDIQLRMEEIAAPLGWLDELHLGMFRGEGWLGDELPRTQRRNGKTPLPNARSPCPRKCGKLREPHHRCRPSSGEGIPVGTERPWLLADCPRRRELEALIELEYVRRELEASMVADIRKDGLACCGTMERCQLREPREKPASR